MPEQKGWDAELKRIEGYVSLTIAVLTLLAAIGGPVLAIKAEISGVATQVRVNTEWINLHREESAANQKRFEKSIEKLDTACERLAGIEARLK